VAGTGTVFAMLGAAKMFTGVGILEFFSTTGHRTG